MIDKIEEAYTEYQFNKMVDPATRYTHDDRDVFRAGWSASQKRPSNKVKESVWVHAPVAPDDDPE
jgi:hypothetical protein